jgi:hypothetical protein
MVQVWEKVMARPDASRSGFSGRRSAPRTETVDDATWNKMSYSEKKDYAAKFSGGR